MGAIRTVRFCVYFNFRHNFTLRLSQKSVSFDEIKIDGDSNLRSAMIERSQGAYTVPQIFINDEHVGGCDQLVALESNNTLDNLLNEHN
jgi:glutaredoxin 3